MTERKHLQTPLRIALIVIGAISLVLGIIGLFLPVLPTTPFVLLTAACWSRSVPRWHGWLLAQPKVGPIIEQWERNRTVPRRVKLVATAFVVPSIGTSTYLMRETTWLVLMLVAIAVIVIAAIWLLPEPQPEVCGD